MPTLIIKENKEEILFSSSSDSMKLVELVIGLNKNNIKYSAHEVSIDSQTHKIDRSTMAEIIIDIDNNIDLKDTIKCTSFMSLNSKLELKKFEVFTNSKKRISPIKVIEEYKDRLEEFGLIGNIDLIFSSWAKKYRFNDKNIYEENSVWFKLENSSWEKSASKKRRHF